MELRDYLAIIRRQWAIIAVITVAMTGAAYALTEMQDPRYEATARLFVSAGSANESVDQAYQGGLFVQQRLRSYVEVVGTPAVLDSVIDELDLDTTSSELADRVSAAAPSETVLIDVVAASGTASEAADVANETASQLARYIEDLESRESQTEPPVKVSVVEPAEVPSQPVSPNQTINLALGLFAGLALGIGTALLRESLNRTVRTSEMAEQVAASPILGTIASDSLASRHLLGESESRTPRAESFRVLRTNIQYLDADDPVHVLVVTSAVAGEGKSSVAANLAVAMAQADKRVLFLEGDLRRPRTVEMFGVVDDVGLTNVLFGQAEFDDVVQRVEPYSLDVLPCGPRPPNPAELLASRQMEKLIGELRAFYDLVVIDSPPLLPVTDAAVLARLSDGAVVVVQHGKTKREDLRAAAAALSAVKARLLGLVLNKAPRSPRGTYSY